MELANYFEVVYSSVHWHDRWDSNEDSGCSLHKNIEDFELHVKRYQDKITINGEYPERFYVYAKPIWVKVCQDLYDKVLLSDLCLHVSLEEEQAFVQQKKIIFPNTEKKL